MAGKSEQHHDAEANRRQARCQGDRFRPVGVADEGGDGCQHAREHQEDPSPVATEEYGQRHPNIDKGDEGDHAPGDDQGRLTALDIDRFEGDLLD